MSIEPAADADEIKIEVRKIDASNCFDICELTSNKDGIGTVFEEFVCCNATSIVESVYFPRFEPRALYCDGAPIGFFMYQQPADGSGIFEVCRYMIDFKYIGKGYGRASLAALVDYLKGQGAVAVVVMIDDHNVIAKKLYMSFGFTFTGRISKDEHYYQLELVEQDRR